jgi:hypothetical protein
MNAISRNTIIEIPAGAFYVYNPNTQPNVIPHSSGAFGCCYLTIKNPNGLVLLAHINATSVFVKETANLTVKRMLNAFENGGGDLNNAEFKIIHTNDPQEYENGFQNRPQNITPDQQRPRGHYSERLENTMEYPFVAEPFANVALQKALEDAGVKNIKPNGDFNTNLGEFMANPDVKPIKTNIIIDANCNTHLSNFDNNTGMPRFSSEEARWKFQELYQLTEDKINNTVIIPDEDERCTTLPNIGAFYVQLANDIKDGVVSVENGIATAQAGAKDYTKFAAANINEFINQIQEHKQSDAPKLNFENIAPHHQMPTISTLLKEGKVNKAAEYAETKKSQKTFVEKLKESVKDSGTSYSK